MKRAARQPRPRTNDELSEETQRQLLAAGRRAFAARGYAAASAEEIAEKAGLTRGALHYQFGDKRGLFEAVVKQILAELAARVARRTMEQVRDESEELERGCDALLAAYGEPEIQSVLLRDAPVVLGWGKWRELQEEAGLVALLRHALEHWADAGWIGRERVEPLARLLLGALTQAGVAIGEAKNRRAVVALYRGEVCALVRSLAPRAAKKARRARAAPKH